MKNVFYLLATITLILMICNSCDESDSNELANTMWIYSNEIPPDRQYFEFSKDTLFMWTYNFSDSCSSISSRFKFKIENDYIITKSSDSIWLEFTKYDISGDTLKLYDIGTYYNPDYLRMLKFKKNVSSWKICN